MDKYERLHKLNQFLNHRRVPITIHTISEHLDCSDKTTYRLLQELRDIYHAPLVENTKGYRHYDLKKGETFELPGLWFNDDELYALLAAHQYLNRIEPGLLGEHIRPLLQRIEELLNRHHKHPGNTLQRIRILGIGNRSSVKFFPVIASAVLQRQDLFIHYLSRSSNKSSERTISPQRLTHYRDNWYLDAWCHLKQGLRTFALDQIEHCRTLETVARDIDDAELDRHLASAYGIFAGEADQLAVLKFNEKRARWITKEQWHPQQQGEWQGEHYVLQLPYHNPTELVMDILKYGPDVEVLAPESLRQEIIQQIIAMQHIYD